MNAKLRQKLEQEVKNQRVIIWFTEKHAVKLEEQDRFLSASDLTDVELSRLRNDIFLWNMKSGLLTDEEGRTVSLNWEC